MVSISVHAPPGSPLSSTSISLSLFPVHGFSLTRRIQSRAAVAQDLPDQAEAGQEAAPEPPHPVLDPHEDRQHHQVRLAAMIFPPVRSVLAPRNESLEIILPPLSCCSLLSQVQREAQALAPHQARLLSSGRTRGRPLPPTGEGSRVPRVYASK